MNRLILWIPALMAVLTGCTSMTVSPASSLPGNAVPPRIAVTSFDNRSGFSGQWELGPGMADLLVAELVLSRNFVVLERGRIDTVVSEIVRQRDKLFRPEGRVEGGRLENAGYLIRGVITDFSQVSAGSFWVGIRRFLLGGGGYTARVSLTLTIIHVESGRILDSVSCAAAVRARSAFAEGGYKGIRFGGDQFFKTPLGLATSNAIRRGIKEIVKKVPRQYWAPMIADVVDGRIVINGGKDRKIKTDQYYTARAKGTPVRDPVTGDVLEITPGRDLGLIRVQEVRETASTAEIISGFGFDRGQHLILASRPESPSEP